MTDKRQTTADGFRQLAEWAAGVGQEDIPNEVVQRACRILVDDLCAIIGARDEPEVSRFHDRQLARAAIPEATVFGRGRSRTDRLSAAVANAVAANWLELDEGYRKAPCHAGLYVLPALLADAEARRLPFAELLRALVLGYEIVTRVARAFTPANMGQHSHARYSAVGAAAGVGIARRLSGSQLLDVLSTAATLINAGPRPHVVAGALVRNAWPALGAWSGLMSLDWAECGLTGIPDSLHDVYSTVLGGEANPEALTGDLGVSWAVLDGYSKLYACCQYTHAAVEASLALRPQILERGALDQVTGVEVATHQSALPLTNQHPPTTLAGKFSVPHAVAAALVTGGAGAEAFAARLLDQPDIARVRGLVTVSRYAPDLPPPNDRPARVTVSLRDGRRFVEECLSAQGGPDRPLPPSVLDDKIARMVAPAYPAAPQLFSSLMWLELSRLNQSWDAIVAELCGSASEAGPGRMAETSIDCPPEVKVLQ